MPKPKPYTPEEARKMFLDQLRSTKEYWLKVSGQTEGERMDGLIFSILVMLDGGTIGMPAMDIRLCPHKNDKAYHISKGEQWFKPGQLINDCQLHEQWYSRVPDAAPEKK